MNVSRHRTSDVEAVGALAAYLTPRDFGIITCLAEQHLATAAHLGAVFFPSGRAASARLAALTEMEVLDRSRVPGRSSYRYTLGWAGAAVYALRNGKTPPTRRIVAWQGQQALFSAHRNHKEGVLTFFALLHLAARSAGDAEVTEWMPEGAAAAEIISARPDGAGTVTWSDGRRLRFWYEHDTGTETIGRLTEVIERYRDGRLPGSYGDRVLLLGLPGRVRIRHLVEAAGWLGDLAVAVAVNEELPPGQGPRPDLAHLLTGPHWHRLGHDQTSLRDLATAGSAS
ncbi:replication-relaxation family protein [Glycomyces dulcitolivorans]|uniref:replication-relaxation family protein n=1 Tax=Glycomyces dulcitolivorans TaxID=2200759 RepID=UPI000DD48DCE|nr:replication-relaxation family protein [Glycomyces dulcitolivorans]